MFGFLKRRIAREHMKLMYQNSQALAYCTAFIEIIESHSFKRQIEIAEEQWNPGEPLEWYSLDAMIKLNRILRRVYSRTPGPMLRSFDKQYTPILGWKEYYLRMSS